MSRKASASLTLADSIRIPLAFSIHFLSASLLALLVHGDGKSGGDILRANRAYQQSLCAGLDCASAERRVSLGGQSHNCVRTLGTKLLHQCESLFTLMLHVYQHNVINA